MDRVKGKRIVNYLSLGFGESLIPSVLRLTRCLLSPNRESDPRVGEDEDCEREEVLEDH